MPEKPRHAAPSTPRSRLAVLVGVALVLLTAGLVIEAVGHPSSVRGTASVSMADALRPAVADATSAPTTTTTTTTTTTLPPPMTIEPLPSEPGLAPVITRVETNDPVVFLTIDDGLVRLPEGQATFEELGMPASLFLINEPIQTDPDYFRRFPGTLVEGHSQSHRNMQGMSEAEQEEEICGNADVIEQIYGRRPVLFRPPGGSYDQATRRAAAACGMKAVVIWQENVNYDVIGYRSVQQIRPGDVILMHFRPQIVQELNVIQQRVAEAGLRFALLEDYIAPETVPANLRR